ncbi:MAG: class I lanthipeptide [Acidobacteriota bacterium]
MQKMEKKGLKVKKLVLSKETIHNLTGEDLGQIRGGGFGWPTTIIVGPGDTQISNCCTCSAETSCQHLCSAAGAC